MSQSRTPKRGHALPEGAGSFYYAASSDRWVGVVEAMKPGGLVIEMSSGVPARTIAIGERLGKVDLRIVDAPVSGGLEDAALAGHSAPSTMRKSLSAASPSRRSAS